MLTDPRVKNRSKNNTLAFILEFSEGQVVVVTCQPLCNRVSTAPWWTHSAHKVDVSEVSEFSNSLAVVPPLEVHPLTDELDGRLCAVHLQCGHVEVINKEDHELAKRWTKHAFTPERTSTQ